MRHFHDISNAAIISYEVNGEYFAEIEEAHQKAISQLAKAIELPRIRVKQILVEFARFGMFHGQPDADRAVQRMFDDNTEQFVSRSITPGELRVIGQFYEFYAILTSKGSSDRMRSWTANGAAVFSYHNINTGVSCIWVHMVV